VCVGRRARAHGEWGGCVGGLEVRHFVIVDFLLRTRWILMSLAAQIWRLYGKGSDPKSMTAYQAKLCLLALN